MSSYLKLLPSALIAVIITLPLNTSIAQTKTKKSKISQIKSETSTNQSQNKCQFQGHFSSINSVDIHSDSQTFISTSNDNSIKLWNIDNGKLIRTFRNVGNIGKISQDGKSFISADKDNNIRLWNISTGKLIRIFDKNTESISYLDISPDNKIVISGSWDNNIQLWDISTGKLIRRLRGHSDSINAAIVTPDGNTVISSSYDGIKIWDIKTASLIRTIKGHSKVVSSLAITQDGQTLFSGGEDGNIKLWNIKTGKEIRTLKEHSGRVESLVISSDGSTLISGAGDNTIKLWDIANQNLIHTFGKPIKKVDLSKFRPKNPPSGAIAISFSVSAIKAAISPDGKTIVSTDGINIQLWDVEKRKQLRTIKANYNGFGSVFISPDNQTLVSLNIDSPIDIWNRFTGRKIRTIKDEWVQSIDISPNGNTLVTGGWGDKTIKLWNIKTGKLVRAFKDTGVDKVAISPDGKILISSHGELIKLRDISTGKLLRQLESSFSVSSLAVSDNGKFLVTRNVGDEILLWDMQTGKLIRTLKKTNIDEFYNADKNINNIISVTSATISPNGRIVASGYSDGTIKLQDSETGNNIYTLKGHDDGVSALAISPDGNTLVSTSQDNSIKIWDIFQRKLIHTLSAHLHNISSVDISPDGKTLVSGSWDNTMKEWDISTGKLLNTFCVSPQSGGKALINQSFLQAKFKFKK